MKMKPTIISMLLLIASIASASPCFKLPRNFQPLPPTGSVAVIVVVSPTPALWLPLEQWRVLSPDEMNQVNEELAQDLVLGLQSKGVDAKALGSSADALVYRTKGRICANPNEAELIKSQVSEIVKTASLDSAIAVRLMVHRQQYHKMHMNQFVNREEAIVAKDGSMPLLYTANGEVHVISKDGHYLNYFLELNSWGVKKVGNNQYKILNRSEWLAELSSQLLTTLNVRSAGK